MRLGEMLVRDGRLTEAQLKQALALQARDGGRIGTVLVEHRLIDLEALTVYLGLELGIPIATGAMLERAKRAAVRLLQPVQAFNHKCVPLVVQDRQLIAAMEDPHDLATLESLQQITGYRLLPRVCPELRIYYYVERYYGVARPARFMKFGDLPRGDDTPSSPGLPAPPLPGLPPVPAAPVAAPGPRPTLKTGKIAKFDESESLELDAEDMIETLDADDAAPAEAAEHVRPARTTTPPFVTPPQVAAERPEAIRADAAIAELARTTDRNRIIGVLMGFASGIFEGAVLFTVKDHLALGWKAFGNFPGHAHIEHVLIPLDAPSIVRSAVSSDDGVFHGAPTPSTVNTYFYKVLGISEPRHVATAVISIGKRVVNVLYGHGKELTPLETTDLKAICAAAADAYTRIISAQKAKR